MIEKTSSSLGAGYRRILFGDTEDTEVTVLEKRKETEAKIAK